jgi:hypothetical protein
VKILLSVWIKIDETLPWIELKGKYETRDEARKAVRQTIERMKVKVVSIPEERKPLKSLATVKATR